MPEPKPLQLGDMTPSKVMPTAATKPRNVNAKEQAQPKNNAPFQLRWPDSEFRAMKKAAVDAGLSQSEYMLTCFHAYNKTIK